MEEKTHIIAQGFNMFAIMYFFLFASSFFNTIKQCRKHIYFNVTVSLIPPFSEKNLIHFNAQLSNWLLFTCYYLLMRFISVVLSCVLNVQERKRKKEEAASAKLLENEKRNKVRRKKKNSDFSALFLGGATCPCVLMSPHSKNVFASTTRAPKSYNSCVVWNDECVF